METVQSLVADYGIKLIAALVIVVLGRWAVRLVTRLVRHAMERSKADPMLISFTGNVTYAAGLAFVVIAALHQIGIQTTSFIAIVGAAGLAVALAFQSSLSNLAAGVLMLVFRPFRIGDYVEAGGTAGTVDDINIFTTRFKTPDNKIIHVPNGSVMGANIVNYSDQPTRRVDMVFGIGYGDDLRKAKRVLEEMLAADERVLPAPAPVVAVGALADSSVNLLVRPWVDSANYWSLYWDFTEQVKLRFDEEGISIPYPQRDVHLHGVETVRAA